MTDRSEAVAQRVADALGYEFESDGQSLIDRLAERGLRIEVETTSPFDPMAHRATYGDQSYAELRTPSRMYVTIGATPQEAVADLARLAVLRGSGAEPERPSLERALERSLDILEADRA